MALRTVQWYVNVARLQSLAFFLVFAAFNAAQALVGSFPAPPGLPPFQFMSLYATFALACVTAPKLVVWLGAKRSIFVGALPYLGLVVSFLSPSLCEPGETASCWGSSAIWALRISMGVLVGLGAPLLWTGQGVYLGQLAAHAAAVEAAAAAPVNEQSASAAESQEAARGRANTRFNGIFWSAFQFSGSCGLVASSLVLAFVHSSDAFSYLFIGLSGCVVVGLIIMATMLPSLAHDDAERADGEPEAGGAVAQRADDVGFFATLQLCADPRMYLIAPNIVYNGLSLAFIWYLFGSFGWNTALGTSFVGFGSAATYTVVSIFIPVTARLAARFGQLPVMLLATASQIAFFAMLAASRVDPIQCLPSGCVNGTSGSCWKLAGPGAKSAPFPIGCRETGAACATCVPYNADYDADAPGASGQQCDAAAGWRQCEWLHGDAVPPPARDVAFLFVGAALFSVGDAVWEGQVPAVLQTLFDRGSGKQPAAMANLKLWQSLGIGAMFGLAKLNDVRLGALICLCSLGVSTLALVWAHARVASLDTGVARRGGIDALSGGLLEQMADSGSE